MGHGTSTGTFALRAGMFLANSWYKSLHIEPTGKAITSISTKYSSTWLNRQFQVLICVRIVLEHKYKLIF